MQFGVLGEKCEIAIIVKDREPVSDRGGRDETVRHGADRYPVSAAGSVEPCSVLKILGLGGQERCSAQKTSEISQMLFGTSARAEFHDDGAGDRSAFHE